MPRTSTVETRLKQKDPSPTISCAHAEWIKTYIKPVIGFPKPGVTFLTISPLLRNPKAFDQAIKVWVERYEKLGLPDLIIGIESRGFFLGAVLANKLKIPFAMMRKPGKVPNPIRSEEKTMEYGTTALEIEEEIIEEGNNVLVIDDVLATGGTAEAACELIEKCGGRVYEVSCMIEIAALEGSRKLQNRNIFTLIQM